MSTLRRNLCMVLLTLLGLSLGCSEFVVIGIETELAASFGITLQHVGMAMSAYALAFAICTPVLAVATGRFRRYTLLLIYTALFCIGNAVAAFAPTFDILLAARVLIGAVSGALLSLGVTYVPELLGRQHASLGISVVYSAFSVAMVVATSAGKAVADALDWRVAMVAAFVLGIAVCVALVAALPRAGATDEPASARDQLVLLREPPVLCGVAIFVFGVGSVYTFYGYVTPYLEQVLHLSAAAVGGVLIAYGTATLVSNLASGVLADRVGLRALVPSFLVQAALLAGLFALGGAAGPAVAVIIGIGVSMYLVSVPCVAMFMKTAYDRHPRALTLASSLEPMAFNIGIAFGTAVGGAVVAGPGIRYAGAVGAAFSIVACALVVLCLRLIRRARVRSQAAA